jgi:Chalcone isomerase-like
MRRPEKMFGTGDTMTGKFLKFLFRAALILSISTATKAAEIDGVAMPETMEVSGTRLLLNGLAQRTYSFLRIHIYVAGLYLQHRSSDAQDILASGETKLLHFVFTRDIDAEAARKSWRESLDSNCRSPCSLGAENVKRFLDAIPSMRRGESSTFLFKPEGLEVFMNEKLVGRIPDKAFVRVILATFIGSNPTSGEVKRGLLQETH